MSYFYPFILPDYVMNHPDREKCFPAFMTWLEENGVDTNAVSIEKYDVTGYGLKANKPIEVCLSCFDNYIKIMF